MTCGGLTPCGHRCLARASPTKHAARTAPTRLRWPRRVWMPHCMDRTSAGAAQRSNRANVRCGARRARGTESECLHDGKRLPGTAGGRP
eukprot:366374-Chlamydomonas_euryale.AAC.2